MLIDLNNNEYINVDDALKRIGGNMDLYKRLLKRFIDGNNVESLECALQGGDMEESARLAHTLKGVSANLSLFGIRSASFELEQVIKNGMDYAARLSELKQVFSASVEIITEITK